MDFDSVNTRFPLQQNTPNPNVHTGDDMIAQIVAEFEAESEPEPNVMAE